MYTAFINSFWDSLLCKTVLIFNCVGGTEADPHTYVLLKMDVFLLSLALSVQIFNKKSHQVQAMECFKLWIGYFKMSDDIFS